VMHFTGAMLRTLGKYWTWSVGAHLLTLRTNGAVEFLPAGIAVGDLGLAVFRCESVRAVRGCRSSVSAWYVRRLAPVLRASRSYDGIYVYLPVIGICWLADGRWCKRRRGRAYVAIALAAMYAA